MQQGIVRETQPSQVYENMPFWMQHVCNNSQAWADFYADLTKGIVRCNELIADLFGKGEDRRAATMLGKKEALEEMRFMLEAYRKENTHGR